MEQIRVHHSTARIEATEFNLEGSEFTVGTLRNSHLKNIMLSGTVIDDVNGSDMKIINANRRYLAERQGGVTDVCDPAGSNQ